MLNKDIIKSGNNVLVGVILFIGIVYTSDIVLDVGRCIGSWIHCLLN